MRTITWSRTSPPRTCRIRSICRRTCWRSRACASIASSSITTTIAPTSRASAPTTSCRRVPVSIYTSYSVSYLPGSGDQFSSLTNITEQLKPEQFTSYEVGAKWDARPGLSLTTAVYRLDRTNTRSTHPNDPTRIVQTGSQRTNGYELGANGYLTMRWSVAGGYAYQDAYVSQATASAVAGASVGQVPHHTFS